MKGPCDERDGAMGIMGKAGGRRIRADKSIQTPPARRRDARAENERDECWDLPPAAAGGSRSNAGPL